jgi:ribonuclease HI
MDIKHLAVFSDSRLVIKQINGDYRVTDPRLKTLHAEALMLLEWFKKIVFVHIRRERNALADALAEEYFSTAAANKQQFVD